MGSVRISIAFTRCRVFVTCRTWKLFRVSVGIGVERGVGVSTVGVVLVSVGGEFMTFSVLCSFTGNGNGWAVL
jgi:hypothetical protein